MFIDIHCHKFYDDGTIFLFSQALGRDEAPPEGVMFSAGVHPWAAAAVDLDWAVNCLYSSELSAIGEIGLDYAVDVSHDVQLKVFERQLRVAAELRLPVVIHCVRAFNDVVSALSAHDLPAVIFHGYIGSPEQTAELLRHGYYMSFGGRSLASPKTVESLLQAPLSAIFAETDDEPLHVREIYRRIASLRGITAEELQLTVSQSFNTVFPRMRHSEERPQGRDVESASEASHSI